LNEFCNNDTVAHPGGKFGTTSPPNGFGARSKWRNFDKNAPLFGAYRSRNKGKNTKSKLNNALHFVKLQYYVTDFDPASHRLESTLLLFRNNTPVPLFLFRVRTAQHNTNTIFFAKLWSCRWAVQNWSVFVAS